MYDSFFSPNSYETQNSAEKYFLSFHSAGFAVGFN